MGEKSYNPFWHAVASVVETLTFHFKHHAVKVSMLTASHTLATMLTEVIMSSENVGEVIH